MPRRPGRTPLRVERLEPRDLWAVYLRVVDYNIAGDVRAGVSTILEAIGDEPVDGRAQPIDILTLQEVNTQADEAEAVKNLLNTLYPGQTYARGTLNATTSGSGRPGVVYRTGAVTLVEEVGVNVAVNTFAAARRPVRYQFRPVGYDSSFDFFIYNSHYKSGDTAADRSRRDVEADAIRADADALGDGVNVGYFGDFNTYSSSEPGYQSLLAAGPGQAFDPLNRPGNWSESSSFATVHTQSPTTASVYPGQITGGLDDRFDFQLLSGELFDGVGLDYVAGSYRAFGNNGTTYNTNITNASNTIWPAGHPLHADRAAILTALRGSSDHLPVVADYVLPDLSPPSEIGFTAAAYATAEGEGAVTVTVTRSDTAGPASVRWETADGSAESPADYAGGSGTVEFADGQATATFAVPVVDDATAEPDQTFTLTLSAPVGGVLGTHTTAAVTIADPPLRVTGVTAAGSAVRVTFNRRPDQGPINLYDRLGGSLGPTDFRVLDGTGQPAAGVKGSLVFDPAANAVTFVNTSGVMPAGSYSVKLLADTPAQPAFRARDGRPLDGDADGTPGGDATVAFTAVAPAGPVLAVPGFARGAGQAVNLPATAAGLPLTIRGASGVTSIAFQLAFDPTLLAVPATGAVTLSSAASAAGLVLGSYSVTTVTPRRAVLSGSAAGGAGWSPADGAVFARLAASVPDAAPYTEKAVLEVAAAVNGGPAVRTAAVQAAAYVGDVAADRVYTALDSARITQVGLGRGTGFPAYKTLDPVLIGGAGGGSSVTSLDAALVTAKGVGLAVAAIPDVPTLPAPPPTGADPRLYFVSTSGRAGETVTVRVRMNVNARGGAEVAALDQAIRFDPTRFRVSNARTGGMIAGFVTRANIDHAAGTIRIGQYTGGRAVHFPDGSDGEVLLLDFTVLPTARAGVASLNLMKAVGGTTTAVNGPDGPLPMIPAPTDGGFDALVDGVFVVRPNAPGPILRSAPVYLPPEPLRLTPRGAEADAGPRLGTKSAAARSGAPDLR